MPELIRIQQSDKEGWEWSVLVLAPGLGANNQYFPPETLRQAVGHFEGARVFCLPDGQHSKTGDKSAQHIVGWLSQAVYDAATGIKARLTLLKTADWLRQNLVDSHAKGRPDLYGMSVDAPGRMEQRTWQGKAVQWITEFFAPVTVDVVWNPGTPGGFQRALNAHVSHPYKEDRMNREELIKILQAKRPDLLEGKDPAAISMEDLTALLTKALAEPSSAVIKQAVDAHVKQAEEAAANKAAEQARAQNAGLSEADRVSIQQAQIVGWNGRIAPLITESQLPQIMQTSLRARFMDALPADGVEKGVAAVKQAIEESRKVVDALSAEGRVEGLGYSRGLSVESEPERLQQAMDKMFGIDVKGDVPAFVSLRQAYVRITGDTEVSGLRGHEVAKLEKIAQAVRLMQAKEVDSLGYPLPGHVRITQAQPAAAWPLLLGNSLYRRLRMAYAEVEYYEDRIISTRRRATDYRSIEAMTPHYPADLPIVLADADYTELPTQSEEGVNYKVAKRGRIITISRETILGDDLGAVVRMVNNEGRAARRTFARAVWNLLISNATFDGDAVALFHASHNNLGSTALTADATGVAALVARLNALMAQTEPGSGEKLGGAWWGAKPMLAVPGALQAVAKQLNQSDGIPGTANNGDNPVRGLFGNPDAPERILVNPLFTDATDWYVLRQPTDVEQIEVAFLMGQEQPEVFVADNQQVGQMFMADKLQYKIRHEYGADVVDYRGMDKSVVAG